MVLIGYRHMELDYVSQPWLVFIDIFSKVVFGCILLPFVYLFGFLQRENSENVYKSLGLILYLVGHLINMILLSIVGFISNDTKVCSQGYTFILYIGMLNPFTYNFFNAVLDHFICKSYVG
jgi:quinol-cytochrome oxidoreductase complex cytochrome b subunit